VILALLAGGCGATFDDLRPRTTRILRGRPVRGVVVGPFAYEQYLRGALAMEQSEPALAAEHFRAALSQLQQMPPSAVLPETDGLTAGEIAEMVTSLMGSD